MKHILLGAAALIWGLSVQAQESLFPELKNSAAQPQSVEEPVAQSQEGQMAEPVVGASLNQPVGEEADQNEADEEGKKTGDLLINITDVTIVVPPVEKMQFCTGIITLENQTKETVNAISLQLDYGKMVLPYTFSGVPAGDNVRGNFGMAGFACQNLTQVPPIKVVECSVGDWTKEQCQSRIKYKRR